MSPGPPTYTLGQMDRKWHSSWLFVSAVALCGQICLQASPAVASDTPQDEFPYILHPVTDPLLGGAALLGLAGYFVAEAYVDGVTVSEVENLHSSSVNGFDRFTVRQWSPGSAVASTVTSAVAGALPLITIIELAAGSRWRHAAVLALMAAEATVLNLAVTNVVKVSIGRRRPYLYNDELSLERRMEHPDSAARSFYSSHTSIAFCGAAFFSTVFSDLLPSSNWRYAVWPLSLSLAAATGILRITAGQHFPTDVLTGAVTGGLIGYGVPALHRRPGQGAAVALLPAVGDAPGFSLFLSF